MLYWYNLIVKSIDFGGIKYIKELKISKKEVSALLIEALTQTKINLTENNKIQLRFVLKLSI